MSYQRKMQAAHHWDLLAKDVAQRVVSAQGTMGGEGVFVKSAPGLFGTTFASLLKTELVNCGVNLATAPTAAATLDVEVQLIPFRAKWPNRATRMQPGFWTAVASGIRLASNITKNMIIPAGVAMEFIDGSTATLTQHEVVITTSLQKDGRYLMRQANIYYVNDADRGQYAQLVPGTTKTLEVVAQ